MYKIVVTEPAERDLTEAVSYIANTLKNPNAAKALANEFEKKASALSEMPKMYQISEDKYLASKSIRAFTVKNYIVFYIVRDNEKTVSIIRFLYGKRDWETILGSKKELE